MNTKICIAGLNRRAGYATVRRELVEKGKKKYYDTSNSRRRAFARNVHFFFIVPGSERTFTFRVCFALFRLFVLCSMTGALYCTVFPNTACVVCSLDKEIANLYQAAK